MKVTFRFIVVFVLLSIITWFFSEFLHNVFTAFLSMTESEKFILWLVLHISAFSLSVFAAVLSLEDE